MDALIQQIIDETDAYNNPYFSALRAGDFDKEDFVETQIQFYFAVVFFSRPMAAVAAKIPSARQRVAVLRNVWEEHGEGDEPQTHGTTFLMLLDRLADITEQDTDSRALWPEVRLFNTALTGACVMDEYVVGIGVLGMIERMFSEISVWVGEGIVNQGWLSADDMIHYDLHSELDVKHAEDFFAVLRPVWDADNDDRYFIEQGLRLGAYMFNTLYEDLYRARERRAFRRISGSHSRG
jgi:pyrroloquinoline quinone (PQQ) biosynthesis protein C